MGSPCGPQQAVQLSPEQFVCWKELLKERCIFSGSNNVGSALTTLSFLGVTLNANSTYSVELTITGGGTTLATAESYSRDAAVSNYIGGTLGSPQNSAPGVALLFNPASVPEPSTMVLCGIAALGAVGIRRLNKKKV